MNKAERTFEKHAFFAVTPFSVDSPEELKSIGGYIAESGNRLTGLALGGVAGGALGSVAGSGIAAVTGKPGMKTVAKVLGAGFGAATGNIRSLRQTEREAGVQPTNTLKYFTRLLAANVGMTVLPYIGYPIGDYVASRHLLKYKPLTELPTNG